jgi:hypothetical protein
MPAALVEDKAIFLHVPKTGGTWVSHAMRAAGLRLEPLSYATIRPGSPQAHPTFDDVFYYRPRFTFAFVRHPLDWWRSYWRYRMETGWRDRPLIDQLARSDDFDQFVANVIEHLPGLAGVHFSRFVGRPGNEIDFVGHQESLADDLVRALTLAGIRFDERAIHSVSPRRTAEYEMVAYTPDLASRLCAAEAEVIARFYR